MKIEKSTLAKDLVDFTATTASGQKFGRDTLHHFCSPLFLDAMYILFDKNVATTSCGSGRERGILPGITGEFDKLSDKNKQIATPLMISDNEFRLGVEITDTTTYGEFTQKIVALANKFVAQ